MTLEMFMHWFWVAAFAGLGIFMLASPTRYANIEAYFCRMRVKCSIRDRIVEAAERRKSIENISPTLGRATGLFAILCAVIAVFTPYPPLMLYAAFCLGFVGFLGVTYLQLRNTQYKRAASLEIRSPLNVLPVYWYALAFVAALFPLLDLRSPMLQVAAVIVTVCSLTLIVFAWRLALAPALLTGEDPDAEQFVDDRLRFIRTASTLVFAPGITFVYFSQINLIHSSRMHELLGVAADLIWITLFVTFFLMYRRPPSSENLKHWRTTT
jgi:hypothetical protein